MKWSGCSGGKESACSAGGVGLIHGSGRLPGEGNGSPLQYCLENSMNRGASSSPVHGIIESNMNEQLTLNPYKSLTPIKAEL